MTKTVLELQKQALDSNSDIMSLLRKAYLVARKLKLKEFENWINNELNGYGDNEVPEYRTLRGKLKGYNPFRGWIPVEVPAKYEKEVTFFKIKDSIASLVNVCKTTKNNEAMIELSLEDNKKLSRFVGFETRFALFITTNQIYNIIERIKTLILKWSITLEENGVLGEGLEFNNIEKECAQENPVINNYINNFYANVDNTQIQQDTKKSMQSRK